MQHDPYQELGVARGASDEEVKRAFRRRILQTHPDRKGSRERATRLFAEQKTRSRRSCVSGARAATCRRGPRS
ncbi:J domain-containing protein [Nannocystis pusilla]|uniref:J domain-containing protein n=1 Tax=Nannocystis pusilla TaxID=889268 RepID=UPI003B79AAF1